MTKVHFEFEQQKYDRHQYTTEAMAVITDLQREGDKNGK